MPGLLHKIRRPTTPRWSPPRASIYVLFSPRPSRPLRGAHAVAVVGLDLRLAMEAGGDHVEQVGRLYQRLGRVGLQDMGMTCSLFCLSLPVMPILLSLLLYLYLGMMCDALSVYR